MRPNQKIEKFIQIARQDAARAIQFAQANRIERFPAVAEEIRLLKKFGPRGGALRRQHDAGQFRKPKAA